MCWLKYTKASVGITSVEELLTHRAISLGYYWPYMRKNVTQFVQACEQCQRYAPQQRLPP